ncbi:MAG: TetR/AcrR family transcriptional regulator [Actinobacteria bacterium]|nr:TetR/AcrR family transcriptional regulator [Actinomycetota bacterium]
MNDEPGRGSAVPTSFRQGVREAALDAATRQLANVGWDQIRFGHIAAEVGVSRPTLYAEFGNKDGFGEALVQHEAQRFLVGITTILYDSQIAPLSAVKAAVSYTFAEADQSPVTRAILTSGTVDGRTSDSLLPFITTRGAPVMASVNGGLLVWFSEQCEHTPARELVEGVDVIVRVVVSYLLAQESDHKQSTERIGRLVTKLMPELSTSLI